MKTKFRTLLFLASSTLVASSFTSLVACSKPEPEKKGVQIYEPTSKYTKTYVSEDNHLNIYFYGFQYDCDSSILFDENKLSVQTTFSCPEGWGKLDNPVVVDLNKDNKTFNVLIQGTVGTGHKEDTTINGKFSFTYDGKPIEGFQPSTFTTDIIFGVYIISTTTKFYSTHLDKDGNAQIIFEGFQYAGNITNPENFKVSNTFSQTSVGTSFESSVVNFDKEGLGHFDVLIKINGALPVEQLTGNLTFSYYDSELDIRGGNTFYMNLYDVISITQPTDDEKIYEEEFVDSQGKISFTFKGFQFTGIEAPSDITVENEEFSEICSTHNWGLAFSVVNWDTKAQSFAVKVDVDLKQSLSLESGDQLNGNFKFKVDDIVVSTSEKPFTAQIKYAIPFSSLDIENTQEDVILNGLKESAVISNYNALLIPNSVTKIADNAFKNKFVTGVTKDNIKFLSFDSACPVETIGTSAFEGCTSLYTKDLVIPSCVTRIGQSAFKGCTGLDGSLSFPLSSQTNKVLVGESAFAGCKGLDKIVLSKATDISGSTYVFSDCENCSILDFSDLDEKDLPTWFIGYATNKHYFENLGRKVCSATNKGIVLLPNGTSDELKNSWKNKLKTVGNLNIGDESAIWECVIA